MERLTERLKTGEVLMASKYEEKYTAEEWISVLQDRLAAYEDIAEVCGGLDRLRELAEADKDGRVVVLPCQSGEHVFALLDDSKRVRECEVKHAVLDGW